MSFTRKNEYKAFVKNRFYIEIINKQHVFLEIKRF